MSNCKTKNSVNPVIYLITFHRAQSYGAFLQAYALQNCKKLAPFQPTIIDYYPMRFHYKNYVKISSRSNFFVTLIKLMPALICKTRMHLCIRRFVNSMLTLTPNQYIDPLELDKIGFDADLYISGSDQIWDLRYDNEDLILPYYLSFAKTKKYAYASSCGEMEFYNNRNKKKYENVLHQLSTFSGISVRERQSAEDINKCGDYNAVMMLDPTFLLEKKDWEKLLSANKKIKNNYVLVYGLYRNHNLFLYAKKLAEVENLIIVNVCDMLDFMINAKNVFNITPIRLIELIRDAEHVVTDSFHGCAFSIIFGVNLHIFEPATSKNRIENLVEVFNIKERVVNPDYQIKGKMDYNRVNSILKEKRVIAESYLDSMICDVLREKHEDSL